MQAYDDEIRLSNLPLRAKKLLLRLGIRRTDDLCKYTKRQLAENRNVGDTTVLRIEQWLQTKGKQLAIEPSIVELRTQLATMTRQRDDTARLLEEQIARTIELQKQLKVTEEASAIFEENSKSCSEEFEKRLKLEAEREKLREMVMRMGDLIKDQVRCCGSETCERHLKNASTILHQALTLISDGKQ